MTLQEFKESLKAKLGDKIGEEWENVDKDLDSFYNEEFSKVVGKKEELLDEKKKLQREYYEFKEKAEPLVGMGITPQSIEEMKKKIEQFENQDINNPDLKALQERYYAQGKQTTEAEFTPKIQDLEQKYKEYESKYTETQQKYVDTLKQHEIDKVLSDLNVKSLPTWKRGFLADAEAVFDDVAGRISVRVPNPSKPSEKVPLEDWKKLFPLSDEGKSMIQPLPNYGSGANGGNGNGNKQESLADHLKGMFKG